MKTARYSPLDPQRRKVKSFDQTEKLNLQKKNSLHDQLISFNMSTD